MNNTTNYWRGEKGCLGQALRTRETKNKDVKYIRSIRTTRVIISNAVKIHTLNYNHNYLSLFFLNKTINILY